MKSNLKTIATAAATVMLACTALAQDPAQSPAQPSMDQADLHQRMGVERTELLRDAAPVTTILGRKVENQQNEALGRVQDLLLNLATGRIQEVIVVSADDSGRVLTAVPPQLLVPVVGRRSLQLDASPAKFAAAPKYNPDSADPVTESNLVVAVYDYFGEQAYFVPRTADLGTTNQNGQTLASEDPNATIARHGDADSNTIATRDSAGKATGNYYSSQNLPIATWSVLGPVQSARHLLGRPVRNLQDVKLGHVKNLLVDLAAGRVAGVILTSGGFFWIDATISSAPVTAFQYDSGRKLLLLDATPEALYLSPAFTESAWQNFPLPGYSAGEYYPYRIAPFNNAGASAGTERAGADARAYGNERSPELIQGTTPTDQDVQVRIRTALQDDPRLSVNARNILIITHNRSVTLRGPVNTNDEKQLVGEIARRTAAASQVDNQLDVQLTSN